MIRKLTEADREPLMTLLRKEPGINLFILGDVENFGFEQDFMELWGEWDAEPSSIKAVLLRYYRSYLAYAAGPFDVTGFAEILKESTDIEMLSGSTQVVDLFAEHITYKTEKRMHFAELQEWDKKLSRTSSTPESVHKATVNEVEAICALTDEIEEFAGSRESSRRSLEKTLESRTGRTYYMKRDGKVIATASTTAENSMSAMIVAVATHPDHRGQGLATHVVSQLCSEVLAEGRSLCLFYDNPQAAVIYHKLGFRDIGYWSMLYL